MFFFQTTNFYLSSGGVAERGQCHLFYSFFYCGAPLRTNSSFEPAEEYQITILITICEAGWRMGSQGWSWTCARPWIEVRPDQNCRRLPPAANKICQCMLIILSELDFLRMPLNAEPGEGESCPQLSKLFAAQESRSKSLNGHYHQHYHQHDHGNEKDFHDDNDHADCW